jgi:hypothetical protein
MRTKGEETMRIAPLVGARFNIALFVRDVCGDHIRAVFQPRRIFTDCDPLSTQPFKGFSQLAK